jgi:hypothetical protein
MHCMDYWIFGLMEYCYCFTPMIHQSNTPKSRQKNYLGFYQDAFTNTCFSTYSFQCSNSFFRNCPV